MRKREFCYLRSIWNGRDCRSASDSSQILQKFKKKIYSLISQILDKIKIEKIAQIGNYCQLKHQRCASFKLAIDILPGVRLSSWGRGRRGDGSCRNGGCLLPPGRGMTDGRKARLHS